MIKPDLYLRKLLALKYIFKLSIIITHFYYLSPSYLLRIMALFQHTLNFLKRNWKILYFCMLGLGTSDYKNTDRYHTNELSNEKKWLQVTGYISNSVSFLRGKTTFETSHLLFKLNSRNYWRKELFLFEGKGVNCQGKQVHHLDFTFLLNRDPLLKEIYS